MRITQVAAVAALLTLAGTELVAQAPQCRNLRYRGNFRLNSAQQHLEVAARQGAPPRDRERRLGEAFTNLEAAAQGGGADELTLWFMYGRAYVLRFDLRGADTAWARAEAAARAANDNDCVAELGRLRRNERVPLVNSAVQMMSEQRFDSALTLLRKAAIIWRTDPATYVNMASIFYNGEQNDSAIHYFQLASRTTGDTSRAALEARATAGFNAARLLQSAQRYADAETMYREYLAMRPRDMAARTSLASVLTAQGRAQAAAAIYDSIIANADALESIDLFETGVALFRQAQGDSADAQMRARKFDMAARAFELGLQKNPNYRDAIYNLTNTYLAANDTMRAADAARRLIAADPLNRNGYSLLAEVYRRRSVPLRARFDAISQRRDSAAVAREVRARYQALTDTTLMWIQRRDSLAVELSVARFETRDSTANIRGAMQNLQGREAPARVLVIEFMNREGAVAATERVEIPALNGSGNPGSVYDFNLTANARGIIGYRYRIAN